MEEEIAAAAAMVSPNYNTLKGSAGDYNTKSHDVIKSPKQIHLTE
jgi:hypothetical protein